VWQHLCPSASQIHYTLCYFLFASFSRQFRGGSTSPARGGANGRGRQQSSLFAVLIFGVWHQQTAAEAPAVTLKKNLKKFVKKKFQNMKMLFMG